VISFLSDHTVLSAKLGQLSTRYVMKASPGWEAALSRRRKDRKSEVSWQELKGTL